MLCGGRCGEQEAEEEGCGQARPTRTTPSVSLVYAFGHPTRGLTHAPAVEARSLNHGPAREVPMWLTPELVDSDLFPF